jgi:hypothetical protein
MVILVVDPDSDPVGKFLKQAYAFSDPVDLVQKYF